MIILNKIISISETDIKKFDQIIIVHDPINAKDDEINGIVLKI